MTVEIEIGVNLPEEDRLTLTEDDIVQHQPVKTHTGKADMTATVRGSRELEPYAQRQDRINVTYSSGTEWTGYLTDVTHGTSTTQIRADGIGKRLEETRPDYDSIGGPLSYQNERLDAVIRDYWSRTEFDNATVTDQTPETVATDETVQSVDTNSEFDNFFGDITDTTPVIVSDNSLRLAQTGFVYEAENHGNGNTVTDDTYSGGEARNIDDIAANFASTFELEHTAPSDSLVVHYRSDAIDGTHPAFEVVIAGETVLSAAENALQSGLRWRDTPALSKQLEPGTYDVEITPTDGAASWHVDVVAVVDSRFNYEFDNEVHEPGGFLDGPELFPTATTVTSDISTTSFNLSAANLTSTWNDTSGSQLIEISNDGGSNYISASNSSTLEQPFESFGRELVIRYTLDRFGIRDTATPRKGFGGQAVDEYTVNVDGNDLVVITEIDLSRNHFDNLQTLHDFGDFLWVIEHDGGSIANMTVSSFPRGDETRPAPDGFDNPKNQQPEIQSGTYYNSIYLEGAKQEDGTRPSAEIKNEDAIAEDGREISPGVLRDLNITTEAGALYRARSLLQTAQSNNNLVGSVTVPPTITDPGYAREIDLGDGLEQKTVEEVSLTLGTNSAEATFDFSVRSGFAEDISSLRRDAKSIGNQV